jgi:hypothetical protein
MRLVGAGAKSMYECSQHPISRQSANFYIIIHANLKSLYFSAILLRGFRVRMWRKSLKLKGYNV